VEIYPFLGVCIFLVGIYPFLGGVGG